MCICISIWQANKAQLIEDIWGILYNKKKFQQFNEASHACVLQ